MKNSPPMRQRLFTGVRLFSNSNYVWMFERHLTATARHAPQSRRCISLHGSGVPNPDGLAALHAINVEGAGSRMRSITTCHAMMAAALNGTAIFPARVTETLAALQTEPRRSAALSCRSKAVAELLQC